MPVQGAVQGHAEPMVEASVVAERFRISEQTVKRLAAAGAIPSYRVGRQLRFDLAEVTTALRTTA